MDIFQSCKDMHLCNKTRGSEVCEGMSGCKERMQGARKVICWAILDGGIIEVMES